MVGGQELRGWGRGADVARAVSATSPTTQFLASNLGAMTYGAEVTRLGTIGHGAEVGGQELRGWGCGADVARARRRESTP